MPRVTPCRVLRLLVLPWIVLFSLWLFLPSPTISPHQRAAYIQNTLTSGHSLISVVDYMPFRKDPRSVYSGECSECSSLLFHWRLVQADNNILLRLNRYTSKWDAARINITGILDDARQWNVKQHDPDRKEWTPYFSGPLKLPEIAAGNDDEEINLPWFAAADKNLFHYDMHGFTSSPIILRAISPKPGVVEIWNFAVVFEVMKQHFKRVLEDGTPVPSNRPRAWEKLYDDLRLNERGAGLVATFRLPEAAAIKDVVVEELKGELASRTYPMRKALLFPLGPIISIPFFVVGVLSDLFAPLFPFAVLTLVIYVLYQLTRCIIGRRRRAGIEKRRVWGPTGPVEAKHWGNGFDEEKEVGLQRPQTVRLGRSWKG